MTFLLNIMLGLLLVIAPMPDASQKIVGKWKLENGLDMEIYQQNGKFYGKIIALNGFNDGQKLDEHNPDKSQRSYSLIGLVILKDLAYNREDGIWEHGEMYAPHMGMRANLEIKKVEGNELTAVGSKLIFWHTEVWIKL